MTLKSSSSTNNRTSPSMSTENIPDEIAYWYKGHVILRSGLPTSIEGGMPARSPAHCLEKVKNLAKIWNHKTLNTIYIYIVGEGGVIPDNPEIVWYGGRYPTYVRGASNKQLIPWKDPKNKEPIELKSDKLSLIDYYEAQSWTRLQVPPVYPTITIKGDQP